MNVDNNKLIDRVILNFQIFGGKYKRKRLEKKIK